VSVHLTVYNSVVSAF